jgi:sulfatase maturation enzyme AslB (radical SAM superfamily)
MDEPFTDASAMIKRQKEVIDAVSYDGCKSCWAEFVCGKGVCYWKKEHHEKGSLGPSQAQCRENGRLDLIESAYFVHDFLRDRTAAPAEATPGS